MTNNFTSICIVLRTQNTQIDFFTRIIKTNAYLFAHIKYILLSLLH